MGDCGDGTIVGMGSFVSSGMTCVCVKIDGEGVDNISIDSIGVDISGIIG